MSDPIADMLTRIRNAVAMKKEFVEFPSSKMKSSVLSVMKKEGYISNFTSTTNENKSFRTPTSSTSVQLLDICNETVDRELSDNVFEVFFVCRFGTIFRWWIGSFITK